VNQNINFYVRKKEKSLLPGRHTRVPDASQPFGLCVGTRTRAYGARRSYSAPPGSKPHRSHALTHAHRLQPSRWIVATRKRQSRIRAVTPTPSWNDATCPPPTRPRRSPTRQTRRRGRGEARRRRACNVIVSAGCRSVRYRDAQQRQTGLRLIFYSSSYLCT